MPTNEGFDLTPYAILLIAAAVGLMVAAVSKPTVGKWPAIGLAAIIGAGVGFYLLVLHNRGRY